MSYFGTSHLGTPEVAFEKNGEVTWRAKAQAFGETHVTLNTINNPLRFPGQYFDQETGLYQNYFRDYDLRLGRYVQSDPIGLEGGLNRYLYVDAQVVVSTDIKGLNRDPKTGIWGPSNSGTWSSNSAANQVVRDSQNRNLSGGSASGASKADALSGAVDDINSNINRNCMMRG